MRTFGFVGNKIVRADEGQAPDARRASVNSSRGRRLDDSIRDIFDRACATNNLEKWHLRRQANYGRERRISGDDLERARKELKAQALRELARLTKLRDEKGAGGRAENAASG
jgi:hypothetical protein